MTKEEKRAQIWAFYESLVAKGVVTNKGDFAKYVGVSRGTLSGAMNGDESLLTDNLSLRIRAAEKRFEESRKDLPADVSHVAPAAREAQDGVFIPRETLELYTSLARTCERLTRIVENQGLSVGSIAAQKNGLPVDQ